MRKKLNKIDKLDDYKLIKSPELINVDNLLYRRPGDNNEEKIYQSSMCRLLSKELNSLGKIIDTIWEDISEGKFEELRRKMMKYQINRGRHSENFTPKLQGINLFLNY